MSTHNKPNSGDTPFTKLTFIDERTDGVEYNASVTVWKNPNVEQTIGDYTVIEGTTPYGAPPNLMDVWALQVKICAGHNPDLCYGVATALIREELGQPQIFASQATITLRTYDSADPTASLTVFMQSDSEPPYVLASGSGVLAGA